MVNDGRPGTETGRVPRTRLSRPARWKAVWLSICVVSALLFLLPFRLPSERLVLLFCECAIWAGAIAAAWPSRALRVIIGALFLLQLFPIRSSLTRTAIICGFGLLWFALLHANRCNRKVMVCLAAIPVLAALFLALPGRVVDGPQLGREYVRSLLPYRGAVYIWGGENRIGIDCSGLVRCGWIDANLRVGLRTANPRPIREALQTWLNDCSAKELGAGYHGRTKYLLVTRSLNRVDYTRLAIGDIAVSDSGLHTLAYLGSETWIEAEPNSGVKVVHVPEYHDIWFETAMKIVRWRAAEADRFTETK